MTQNEIENKIKEIFEQNYEMLRMDGGHALTEDTKKIAFQQILYYYRKMKSVAENVTDTEVKLMLPEQKTPKGRRFTIEGVVDIVKEGDEIWMYDIKTHDPEYIAGHKEYYEMQLNVYSYIYENLRQNKLDHTAIISTAFPQNMKTAIYSEDNNRIEQEMKKWNPLIEMTFDENKVQATIKNFGQVVDKIEMDCFEPRGVNELRKKIPGTNNTFATRICGNCDGRFSCESYREYAKQSGMRTKSNYKKYLEDYGNDLDQEEFISSNIDMDKINSQPEIPN